MQNAIIIDGTVYVPFSDNLPRSTSASEGKYAIVRSRDQGVLAGFVQDITGDTVTMTEARQLWRWDADFLLNDMANTGPRNVEGCRFSAPGEKETIVLNACGVMYCTDQAAEALRNVPPHRPGS